LSTCCCIALCSYTGFGIAGIMTYLTVNGPDNSLQAWARGYALAELAEEDERFAAYAQDSSLQQEMADKFKAMGKHPDRWGMWLLCCASSCWSCVLCYVLSLSELQM
jgi:hypothetical protein